jgi:kynurenine formamidase
MLIDVSMPITPGSVFRLGTPPVEIARRRFYDESEGEYETVMLSLPAHTATHIDLVFPDNRIGLEQMIGPGKVLDATAVRGSSIGLADVEGQVELCEGDFVLFRTDWSQFVGTDRYYRHPELTPEILQWLISKKVNAVGIDAGGLGVGRTHGECDRLLIQNGIFVIENLANLAQIPEGKFKVYCFPLKMEGVDAIPARVLVEIEGDG